VAESLARLHAVPVVYADVSPNNVFIPGDGKSDEAWLIDADNLQFLSRTGGPRLYTRGYGAPEVVRGEAGATTLSDSYSFALLAFHVLTQREAFHGDLVASSGWGSVDDLEAKALRGEVPWAHDSQDPSNHATYGIPAGLVLFPRLFGLFRRTFEEGRRAALPDRSDLPRRPEQDWSDWDWSARPSMAEWADALLQGADYTVHCSVCQGTYHPSSEPTCPWCDAPRSSFVYVEARYWSPDLDDGPCDVATGGKVIDGLPASQRAAQVVWRKLLTAGRSDTLSRHVVGPALLRDGQGAALTAEFGPHNIRLWPVQRGDYLLVRPDRKVVSLEKAPPIQLTELTRPWHLHCGPLESPHRVLTLRYVGGK